MPTFKIVSLSVNWDGFITYSLKLLCSMFLYNVRFCFRVLFCRNFNCLDYLVHHCTADTFSWLPQCRVLCHEIQPALKVFTSMQRFPPYAVPMDPQVCPPPLSSSQSMISALDKSPASTFKPGHSRSSSTGSSKHSKQVINPQDGNTVEATEAGSRCLTHRSFGDCKLPV